MLPHDFEKLNECHDETGRFCSGVGSPITGDSPSISLTRAPRRLYEGKQVPIKEKPSKLESGELGERIVIAYLQQHAGLRDARKVNVEGKGNNYPVDVVANHHVVEVKTGLVSNNPDAHVWRATIGMPGKTEREFLRTASPEEKRAWNARKSEAIMQRKQKALEEASKRLRSKISGKTYGVILNPETKTADIYQFDGFHKSIRWKSPDAAKGYVGTFRYK